MFLRLNAGPYALHLQRETLLMYCGRGIGTIRAFLAALLGWLRRVSKMFESVQVMRFIASFLVLITHASLAVVERMKSPDAHVWEPGGIGVAIFFVISGFVMMVSSATISKRGDAASIFLFRRLIRIVPMYWLATTIKLFVLIVAPVVALHSSIDFWHVLASYFFVPSYRGDGEIGTLHAVGWTLIYEMFFYLIFSISLRLRVSPIMLSSVVFAILYALKSSGYLDNIFIETYGSYMSFYFVAGMLIPRLQKSVARLPSYLLFFLPGCSVCGNAKFGRWGVD